MAHVMVPFTLSTGSSGETVETEDEEEVVARIAIAFIPRYEQKRGARSERKNNTGRVSVNLQPGEYQNG